MQKVKYYKCPSCNKKYQSLATWANHMLKQHPKDIPDGFTPARYFYFLQTGKKEGSCIVCKSPTEWNEATAKYNRFCNNPECKEKYREEFKKRMLGKYGKVNLLDDPAQQRKMLEAKRNSGKYTFRDGGEVGYVSTYELDFLRMLDHFLEFNSKDIMGPSPHTYYYDYKNPEDKENEGRKFYIPDYYIPSLNLEIEIKQNTSTHPKILRIDKVKEEQKDALMNSNKRVKYIKITDKKYEPFFKLLLEMKGQIPTEKEIENNIAMQPVMESTRSELPDSAFGIPEERKYPLDTEARVRSAIKFFNYVDARYEKQLAENILKAMKKFNITNVNVGEKNRFKKYYNQPAIERYVFNSKEKNKNVNIPKELIEFNSKLNQFPYGILIDNKVETENIDWMQYRTIPIKKFERYKVGTCWDFVNYQSYWLTKRGYNHKNILIQIDNGNDCPSHTVSLVFIGDSVYWIESAWGLYQGIHEYNNEKNAIVDICKKHRDYSKEVSKIKSTDKTYIFEYNTKGLDNNLKPIDFMNKVYNQKEITNQITMESTIATEGILDIPQKIINFFSGNTDKEFVLQSWKDKINGSSNLIGGPPQKSKYVTLSKVLVDNKRGIISIQHINIPLLIQRLRDTYEEKRIDLIFDRTYSSIDIAKFNHKQISRSKMKITSLTVPTFFALELTILFKDLYNRYYTPAYKHIANEIYKNTWLSSTDKAEKPNIDMSRLKNLNPKYTLKDYQRDFIESYPSLKTQLGLRGYYLAFEQGLGKTLTASALAEVLGVQKVYIVCPNTLTSVWYNETRDYFNGKYSAVICGKNDKYVDKNTKFFITNQESVQNLYKHVDANAKSMIIVDEAHNFRNYDSIRVKNLLELKNKLQPTDILMMSGTPVKATPNEIVPALMMLDDKFTDYAAKVYNSCFKLDTYLAMDIVRERFGQVIYRKTKAEVLTLPDKITSDIKVKIGNADKYTINNVKQDVREVFDKRYNELAEQNKKVIQFFNQAILQYSMATKRDTASYMIKVANISNVDNNISMGQFHELDQEFIDTFITNYIQPNPKCDAVTLKNIREAERKLLLIRRSAMGTAIGAIYPKYRAEMFQAMYDENKKLFTNMIENNPKKTVIFSQSLPVIKHICEDLNASGIPTVKVIGGTSATNRADIIDRFKNDEMIKVICATSQSMSTGVTLTEANQMFFFGPPWRNADYMQAQDRIHRIGQTDTVNIYNVILDTVEMNLSDRMDKILKWSGEMASAAIDDL